MYSNTGFLFANAGLRLNFSLGYDFDSYGISLPDNAGGFYDIANVDVTSNNDAKPWISIPLEAGHTWLLKNNNLLALSLALNISFVKYVRGDYSIYIPGRLLTSGKYSSTGSFVGLSLNYIFTNANYRIQKAHRTQH